MRYIGDIERLSVAAHIGPYALPGQPDCAAHIAGYALAEIGLWLELEPNPTICANLDWAHFDLLTDGLVKAAGCEA